MPMYVGSFINHKESYDRYIDKRITRYKHIDTASKEKIIHSPLQYLRKEISIK